MESTNDTNLGIPVENAGIVLVNSFIPLLFERAGLLTNKAFSSVDTQQTAVVFLNYLVLKQRVYEEAFLPLNKVLCGLPLSAPVHLSESLSGEQMQLAEGLLQSMISHWPTIGDMSTDGFRGNWLVRGGILTELQDRWELVVEKRVYDVLLNRAPFSFSMIRFPWMEKPLHVVWNF